MYTGRINAIRGLCLITQRWNCALILYVKSRLVNQVKFSVVLHTESGRFYAKCHLFCLGKLYKIKLR